MARPQMRGPGGRRGMMGGKRSKNPKKTLGRLLHYIRDGYAVQFGVVLVCILISAVVNVAGSMFLRVLIDRDEPLDTDTCEAVSRAIDPLLDEADPIEQSYYLEVGSPGLGRRLTRPEHYEQLKGQKCAAHLIRPDEQGRRDYAGILQGLDADGNVTLTDGEETYAFPVKSAGYVKLCDDEDLFG